MEPVSVAIFCIQGASACGSSEMNRSKYRPKGIGFPLSSGSCCQVKLKL
jgi:hypothetical protein